MLIPSLNNIYIKQENQFGISNILVMSMTLKEYKKQCNHLIKQTNRLNNTN